MILRADLTTNRPPGTAETAANRPPASVDASTRSNSATDARDEIYRRLTQIAIGKEVVATVQGKLDDGSYLVKIADAAARMLLPPGTRPGENLAMVFVAREPRPTFLLTGQPGSVNASLSGAARLIDQLLQLAHRDGAPSSVQGGAPLLARASADATQIANQLRLALSTSGLFYESHLRDWLAGTRTLADIAREPQASHVPQPRPADAQPRLDGSELARLAAGLRELGDGAQALVRMIRDAQRQAGNPLNLDADLIARPQGALPAMDPEMARLVLLQLHTLEQHQVRWQGQLWPGQHMEWDVTEEQSQDRPDDPEASAWSSVLRLSLPNLGPVEAQVRLEGDRVQVRVKTDSEQVAQVLRTHGMRLSEALEDAGTPLDSLRVSRGGDDEKTP